jgi:hypothetical protein
MFCKFFLCLCNFSLDMVFVFLYILGLDSYVFVGEFVLVWMDVLGL